MTTEATFELSGTEAMAPTHENTKRRVSIATENPEHSGRLSPHSQQPQHFIRKISSNSEHSADGPVRRKSILHNHLYSYDNHLTPHHINHGYTPTEEDHTKHWNGEPHYEKNHRTSSRTDSIYSLKSIKSRIAEEEPAHSWWFMLCTKCRQKETTPSWEPPNWQRFCPHPFCPSYRQFARIIALSLIVLLIWGVVYCIAGDTAAPGGQLFGIAFLCICAHFGGWFVTLLTLPALIGMLLIGILFQNVGLINIDAEYQEVASVLREIALVIILTRAGLDLDMATMKRLCFVVLRLGLVPWLVECVIIAIMTHLLIGLPWVWAFLLGSIIAAVSPAVVVPCLFRLRGKGYGVAKGIPTLIIAVSGIDDAASVAIFGIIYGLMFSSESLVFNIVQGPLSVVIGIGFGILWGILSRFIPEKQDPFAVPLRILMLFGGGLISVFGSSRIGLSGAGPLGCVTAAFVSCHVWSLDGWEVEDNPAATAFEIFWMIFEPILFGLTGTLVKLDILDPHIVGLGIACLVTGVVIRMLSTVLVGIRAGLNLKEKFFIALSWMAKATVQAALGPKTLEHVRHSGNEDEIVYAENVLIVCVLSILLTAPLGAILITLSGPRLLTKTKAPIHITEWRRRSHRPSMRDISIIDEEEETESPEVSTHKANTYQTESEVPDLTKKDLDGNIKTSEHIDANENKGNIT